MAQSTNLPKSLSQASMFQGCWFGGGTLRLFVLRFIYSYLMCMNVCLCMYMDTKCVPGAWGGQKKALGFLDCSYK